MELAIRFDVRYSQFLAYLPKPAAQPSEKSAPQLELARKILMDTDKLKKRTLHLAPSLKFLVDFLIG